MLRLLLISLVALLWLGQAGAAVSCAGRPEDVFVSTGATAGERQLDGAKLLAAGMKGKAFQSAQDPAEAFRRFDVLLTTQYGLRPPLAMLRDRTGRDLVERIAFLIFNDYVVAAQMALGVAERSGKLPGVEPLRTVGRMVNTATEPYPEDDELAAIASKIVQADRVIKGISSEAVRPLARWAIRGFAYDDSVATDAALAGVCALKPERRDMVTLELAIAIARLKRGPAIQSKREK